MAADQITESLSTNSLSPGTMPPIKSHTSYTPLQASTAAAGAEFRRITYRPWRQFADLSTFTRPYALGETLMFVKQNLTYFRTNYVIISLSILFLSLLFHPVSLIVFILAFLIWYYFYFSRDHDESVVVFNLTVDDRVVSILLGVLTFVFVGLTGVWLNVFVSGLIAGSIVVLHACFRGTQDLYVDDLESANGGLVSVVGSPIRPSGNRQYI